MPKDYDKEMEGRLLDSDICPMCKFEELEDEMEFDEDEEGNNELITHDRVCDNCGYVVRIF